MCVVLREGVHWLAQALQPLSGEDFHWRRFKHMGLGSAARPVVQAARRGRPTAGVSLLAPCVCMAIPRCAGAAGAGKGDAPGAPAAANKPKKAKRAKEFVRRMLRALPCVRPPVALP